MRSLIISCLIFVSMASCLNELRVDPAKPTAFVRYINGGYEDEPKALERATDGGYVILANTLAFPTLVETTTGTSEVLMTRVKLVKVDQYGTVLWTRILPESPESGELGFVAYGIHVFDGGYIISGEVIKSDGTSNLLIIQTDEDGRQFNEDDPPLPIPHYSINLPSTAGQPGESPKIRGMGATWVSSSQLLVLGGITDATNAAGVPKTMVLAEVNLGLDSVIWNRTYLGSVSSIVNKLYLDHGSPLFGATIKRPDELSNTGIISALPDNANPNFVGEAGDPDLSEEAFGICKTPNGYALVGSSTVADKADRDIFFTKFTYVGEATTTRRYPVRYESGADVGQHDVGNGVCTTSDGGFIILGTIETAISPDGLESIGRGDKDYYLMKTNGFGDYEWSKSFGSKREDLGVAVLQTEDGGYLVLGRTNLANVNTIALIKTNAQGEIE